MSTRPIFQIKQFLVNNFVDPDKELAFLANYGITDISRQGLYKHWRRESIPADLFPVLVALLEIENGAPVSLAKWLK
jgi:hypothetical protein